MRKQGGSLEASGSKTSSSLKLTTEKQPRKPSYNSYLLDEFGQEVDDLSLGQLYVNVSTILGMESKNFIPWALKTFGIYSNPLEAYDNYMEQVSDLGKRIHYFLERDLKGEDLLEVEIQRDMAKPVKAWLQFRQQHEIELISSERICWSPEYRIAGRCDAVFKLNGELYVGDFKTGNNVYDSHFTQAVTYLEFLKSEREDTRIPGIEDAKVMIIQVPREGEEVSLYTVDSYYGGKVTENDHWQTFHALRFIWFMRNVKSRKWSAIIKNMEDILSPLVSDFKAKFSI